MDEVTIRETAPPAYWLASYPKSGNTWARMFLNAYMLGVVDINSNVNVVSYDVNPYHWNAVSPFPLTKMSQQSAVFLRPAVLMHILVHSPVRPVMIKTHSANIVMDGITFFPRKMTGGGVYIVRDPRDVCASLARHRGATIDDTIMMMARDEGFLLHDGMEGIFSVLGSWSRNVRSWQRDWVTVIRYEDMLNDPETEFTKLLKAFDIKVNKPRLRKAIRLCELSRLMKQEKREGFIERMEQEKFFGQGKGWRNELTSEQAKAIESIHSEMMIKFGYTQPEESNYDSIRNRCGNGCGTDVPENEYHGDARNIGNANQQDTGSNEYAGREDRPH